MVDPEQSTILAERRKKLTDRVSCGILLWSGSQPSRNFAANRYPFRASSHFLYFAGLPLVDAVVHLEAGSATLFMDNPPESSALWHGEQPNRETVAEMIGAVAAFPLSDLSPQQNSSQATSPCRWAEAAASVRVQGEASRHQSYVLDRAVDQQSQNPVDRALIEAIVEVRSRQDAAAIQHMRQAASVTIAAHMAGMQITPRATTEAQVRAAMENVILAADMTCAYNSIVTVQGEVLHNEVYHHALGDQDLLLADVGAETQLGWAADVTRTWPTQGKFSATQRSVYEVVLAAQKAAIAQLKPGVEYRDVHLQACLTLSEGLVDLGILRGLPEDLVAQDAHALFFPHGIGHLLGLDVHDMEDLGDLAGYAPGRTRSDRFGLGYLRLDRPLQAGMVVTIEPGFYQVPAILQDPLRRQRYHTVVNWETLEQFADVRGIRIEDDVLITATGTEVLTQALPTEITAIEAIMQTS